MDHRSRRLALTFCGLGHTYMHILAGLYLTIVLALEREWALPYDELIGLWTLGSLMIGLGAPLAGFLSDRWGQNRMMVVFFLVTGAGAIAAGLAGGTTALLLGLAVLGLGASIYHPVGLALVVRQAVNRGQAMGINGIFGSLGVAGAALVAATLTEAIDWRAALIIPGVLSVATGLGLWLCLAVGWVVERATDAAPSPPASQGDAVRAFLVLSVTMVCGGLIFNAMHTAMPKWFEERTAALAGGEMVAVGGLVTAVYMFSALSQVVFGHLADRLPLRTIYLAGLLVQVPLLALLGGLADAPLVLGAGMAVFFASGMLPVENLLLARYTPERYRGLIGL